MQSQIKGAQTDAKALIRGIDGLSERQMLYCNALLEGKSKTEAALVAGYASGTAVAVHRSAKVQAAMALVMERYLIGELAPIALNVASRLLVDEKTPAGVRATLALGVLDRAGFSARRHEKAQTDKDPGNMTREELAASIASLQREIEERTVDVTPVDEPVSEPIDSQAIELYE